MDQPTGDENLAVEKFRKYLLLLARMQIGSKLRAKLQRGLKSLRKLLTEPE